MRNEILIVAIIIALLFAIAQSEHQRNICKEICDNQKIHSCGWFNVHCKETETINLLGYDRNVTEYTAYYYIFDEGWTIHYVWRQWD